MTVNTNSQRDYRENTYDKKNLISFRNYGATEHQQPTVSSETKQLQTHVMANLLKETKDLR